MSDLRGKKIAIIIAFRNFRDAEYFIPKEILESAGAEIKTVSNKIGLPAGRQGVAIGADGGEAQVDFLVKDLNPTAFDAVVFVGGPGCLNSLNNEDSYNIARAMVYRPSSEGRYKIIRETVFQNKLLASICISSIILAKAGVLKGKRATVWNSVMDKSPIKILEQYGAIFEDKPVVVDGNIITANGPEAAKEFGEKIKEML